MRRDQWQAPCDMCAALWCRTSKTPFNWSACALLNLVAFPANARTRVFHMNCSFYRCWPSEYGLNGSQKTIAFCESVFASSRTICYAASIGCRNFLIIIRLRRLKCSDRTRRQFFGGWYRNVRLGLRKAVRVEKAVRHWKQGGT